MNKTLKKFWKIFIYILSSESACCLISQLLSSLQLNEYHSMSLNVIRKNSNLKNVKRKIENKKNRSRGSSPRDWETRDSSRSKLNRTPANAQVLTSPFLSIHETDTYIHYVKLGKTFFILSSILLRFNLFQILG